MLSGGVVGVVQGPLGRAPAVAGAAFLVLVVAGNALQGGTPPLHGDPARVVDFYTGAPTRVALAMALSLVSLVPLACFLGLLGTVLARAEDGDGWRTRTATGGGWAALALLAGGFALNAAGALRAAETGSIAPESAVVFYDGGLVLAGLAAPVALAALLAGTAAVVLRSGALPRWFGRGSAVLAVLGVVTPLSFLLLLLFPLWVATAGALLPRAGAADPVRGRALAG